MHKDAAIEDLRMIKKNLARAGCRKGTDESDVPAEVWRLLLCHPPFRPRSKEGKEIFTPYARQGAAIGAARTDLRICDPLWERLVHLLACIRAWQLPPWQFNVSRCWTISKGNGKRGRPGARFVHGILTFSKAYMRALWQQQDVSDVPDHAFAVAGRRREEAIVAQMILSYRLGKKSIAHYNDFEDVANAFPSLLHTKVSESLHHARHVEEASMFIIHATSGVFTLKVDGIDRHFEAGSGVFAGSSVATDLFHYTYWPAIEEWTKSDQRLCATSPITGTQVNCATSYFVDDV